MGLIMITVQTVAQQRTITGTVISADDGGPLPGVSVKIKGTTQGTSTDQNGKYTIRANQGQVLVFSFIGSATQERSVGTAGQIDIKLASDAKSLNEVVVVGYGTQKRANLTGAVSTVDTELLEARPITDVGRGLQGAVPGLTITTATGDLNSTPKIRLRGVTGSLNTGSAGAQPLILVDNVEIPSLNMVNPDDIESISVLKDAASASIYGTRGAWGVILITTKSGKKGAANRITYSNNVAWSSPTTLPVMAKASDNSIASLTAIQRSNPSATSYAVIGYSVDPASIEKMKEWESLYSGKDLGDEMVQGRDFDIIGGKLYFYRSWDAGKMYMKDWTPQQKHDINITGGSEKTSYNLGVGYLGQDGVLKVNPDENDRYNLSLGVNTSVTDWFDARGKVLYTNTKTKTPFIYSGTQYGPWYYLYRWPSNYPYGTYEGKPFRGAIAEVEQAKMDATTNAMARVSVGGTLKPMKGLTIDADYTYTNVNEHLHQTGGPTYAYDFWSFNGTALDYKNFQSASYNKVRYFSYWNEINTGKLFATYNKDIKDHSFKAIVGGDIELYRATEQSSEKRNLLDAGYGEIDLATGDQYVDGANSHWSTLGFFGRLNYAYKDKYLLELNGRFDGSSKFPVNDLWGFFPSISAGYVLTQEGYMDWSKTFLSFLKVRASYGSVGNQAVGDYRFLPIMGVPAAGSGWVMNGINQPTLNTPNLFSPTLTWETVSTTDIGVDAKFFNGRLGLTFDWFQRKTTDMLTAGVTVPSSLGAAAPLRNFGELEAKGWELAIDFNHRFSNGLGINLAANLSDATEKLTKFSSATRALPGPIAAINTTYYEGMTLGEIWGYQTDRLFTENDFAGVGANGRYIYKDGVPSQAQLETGSFYFGPGDIKYVDLNGDGVIYQGTNTVDDPGDKKVIGNSTPRYQYGFRVGADFKGFDLDVYFQGVGKRELWASGNIVFPGFRAAEGWYEHQIDYWTPENTNTFYPRPADYGAVVDKWNFQPQTRYLLDMSYLRMKNITLGYTLPKSLTERIRLDRLRLYFSGENLLTFDKLDVPIDPEIDFSQSQLDLDRAGFGRAYPYRKTFSFGLQVTF